MVRKILLGAFFSIVLVAAANAQMGAAPAVRFEIFIDNQLTFVGVPAAGDAGAQFLGLVNVDTSTVNIRVRGSTASAAPFGAGIKRSAWDMYQYDATDLTFDGPRAMKQWGDANLGCVFSSQVIFDFTVPNTGMGDYQVDGSNAIADPFACETGPEATSGLRIVRFAVRCPSCGGSGGGSEPSDDDDWEIEENETY